jgi:hypothetical protein
VSTQNAADGETRATITGGSGLEIGGGPRTKVTRGEELTYGPFAPLVRRLTRWVEEAEVAMEEVGDLLRSAEEADSLSQHAVMNPTPPEGSEQTLWLRQVYERVSAVRHEVRVMQQTTVQEALGRWIAQREEATVDAATRGLRSVLAFDQGEVPLTEENLLEVCKMELAGPLGTIVVGDEPLEDTARRVLGEESPGVVVVRGSIGAGTWMVRAA